MSPLLERLNRELAEASDPEVSAVLGARIACIEARAGEFAVARTRIEAIRQVFGDGRSGRVTVWMMVAEGLLHHYERFSVDALDRMSRAQLLSKAMNYTSVAAISSAWLAHIHFESGDYAAMVDALSSARRYSDSSNHDANGRLAAVLSNSFTICGEREIAKRWFHQAIDEASKIGDRAAIEANLYNRAVFLATLARAENCIAEVTEDEVRSIRLEVRSTKNFQAIANFATLPSHTQLWDGRLLMLEHDFKAAIARLESVRDQSRFANHNFSSSYIDLELAFCLMKLNRAGEALDVFSRIHSTDFANFDVDEVMVAAWMKLELAKADSRFGGEAEARNALATSIARYREVMTELRDRLTPFAG